MDNRLEREVYLELVNNHSFDTSLSKHILTKWYQQYEHQKDLRIEHSSVFDRINFESKIELI